MNNKTIFMFIGTTAELIKLAPVINEFKKRKIKFTIVSSGQNDIKFEEFGSLVKGIEIMRPITPKYKKTSVKHFIIWSVRTFFSLLIGLRVRFRGLNKNNSYFIVHGDTVSALMGSLVAYIYRLNIVHIESGLRSFNFLEPFPEEICRYIVSRVANIHFCPNEWSVNNLKSVNGIKISTGENTLIETFWSAIKEKYTDQFVKDMLRDKENYAVVVVHRQEHVIFGTDRISEILTFILTEFPSNIRIVMLMHEVSINFLQEIINSASPDLKKRIITVNRLRHTDFMHLIKHGEFMITDGGSNQEEMYYMGKPCLLLRNYTEQIEGIGRNVILGQSNKKIIKNFLKNYNTLKTEPIQIKERPSKIIVDSLINNT